jgi:hypothetical protein
MRLLKRLGRRACTIFRFCAARDDGLLVFIAGVFGELEYDDDDDDEPSAALEDCRRWEWSYSIAEVDGVGIVIEDDILKITTRSGKVEDTGYRSRRWWTGCAAVSGWIASVGEERECCCRLDAQSLVERWNHECKRRKSCNKAARHETRQQWGEVYRDRRPKVGLQLGRR